MDVVGKVFSRDELEPIANLALERDLLVLSDEVYETLVYDDSTAGQHIKIGNKYLSCNKSAHAS